MFVIESNQRVTTTIKRPRGCNDKRKMTLFNEKFDYKNQAAKKGSYPEKEAWP